MSCLTKIDSILEQKQPDWSREKMDACADAGLRWILRSIEATHGQGSSHHYMPLRGWADAYPETTGYLIETLLDYAEWRQDDALRRVAFSCADWLCAIQLESGAFSGNTVRHKHPSLFNTAQILFGLSRAAMEAPAENKQAQYLSAADKALQWMLRILEPDGSWRAAAFVPGYIPAYYTRALMGFVYAANTLFKYDLLRENQTEIMDKARTALLFYADRFLSDGTVRDWGFRPGAAAFTHTVAYTLEGFWYASKWLAMPDILQKTRQTADAFLAVRLRHDKTAGRYHGHWVGDYAFLCPTGNAQLSVLYREMGLHTADNQYVNAAEMFLREILPHQTAAGALPGSVPIWGPYMRFRYPNWAVKFLLDALKNVTNKSDELVQMN